MKKTFLLIDSFYPINSRNIKLAETIKKTYINNSINIIAWNRENRTVDVNETNYYLYQKFSPAGKLTKKLLNLIGFAKYIKSINKQIHPAILIASHWDMLFILSFIKKKDQILIYENLDIPTANNRIILFILQLIEKYALKKTDAIIFASRFFQPLYSFYKRNTFILENKPLQENQIEILPQISKKKLIVSYIGLVRYLDIMKNLVDAVIRFDNIELYIHGDGQDLEALKNYAANYENIHFTGRYEMKDLPYLYANSDIVWAAYPNKDYNVKYAISNKYHESIEYNTPCIFSEKTLLGEWIEEKGLGITVNPYDTNNIISILKKNCENNSFLLNIKKNLFAYSKEEKSWDQQFLPIRNYINSLLS